MLNMDICHKCLTTHLKEYELNNDWMGSRFESDWKSGFVSCVTAEDDSEVLKSVFRDINAGAPEICPYRFEHAMAISQTKKRA